MKKQLMTLIVAVFSSMTIMFAQSGERFAVQVSNPTVLMDNSFEVKFIIENFEGAKFEAPSFEDFQVVGGPNQSSMMTMINGAYSRKLEYSYYLKPINIGEFYIPPAKIETKEGDLFTDPLKIEVVDNPEGIVQEMKPRGETYGFQISPEGFSDMNIDDFFSTSEDMMKSFGFQMDSLSNFSNGMEDMMKQLEQQLEGQDFPNFNNLNLQDFFQMIPDIESIIPETEEEESTKKKKRKIYKI